MFLRYQKAQLWIAGEGTYGFALRRLAGGSDNILFLGHKTKDELQTLYQNAVALVIPSVSLEVFALVILEAFLQRTPVIVRNIGGMPEIIQESGGGFVYETDQDLVMAMEQLITDVAYRDRLGACGHSALYKKWTADAHLTSYLGLIGQIAAARDDTSPNFK
jgi:glycosyltransferase involved in cell wall biosynthesis